VPRQVFTNATACPHCGTRCESIRTRQISKLYREVVYRCRNPDCDFMFVASITPVHAVFPSKAPNPEIMIPISPQASPQSA